MTRINSNRKGKQGERELAAALRAIGFIHARRSEQHNGRSEDGAMPDVLGFPAWVECKRGARVNIKAAMRQAVRDSAGSVAIPVVISREDHHEWLVTVRLSDVVRLAHEIVLELKRTGAITGGCSMQTNEKGRIA